MFSLDDAEAETFPIFAKILLESLYILATHSAIHTNDSTKQWVIC